MNLFLKNKTSFAMFLIFLSILFLPQLSLAQGGGSTAGSGIVYECNNTDASGNVVPGECDFEDLVDAVKRVLNWGTTFAIFFSVIVIAWAGFNIMISGDNPGKRADAKKMLTKVVIGMIFILSAWLIVTLILRALGADSVVQFG